MAQTNSPTPGLFAQPKDLMTDVPQDFTRFYFSGHDNEAQLMNRYLWYHFSKRLGNGKTLFNKEYLTQSDLWLADAVDKTRKESIQNVHREDLSGVQFDAEGYVSCHQHFSTAYDMGWPFPLWPQSGRSPEEAAGKTAGWHFQTQTDGMNWIWVWGMFLKHWNTPQWKGETAAQGWELHNVKSLGISDNKWQLESTGNSPSITTPSGIEIEAFQAPYLQLRWTRTGEPKNHVRPYIEWQREEDTDFSADRRVYFDVYSYGDSEVAGIVRSQEGTKVSDVTHCQHCLITMYKHPKWTGKIKRIRICLAPGESDVKFAVDSFFTVYDTRHTINNPIFIMSCWNYFRWTGDVDFLRANINRLRTALRYQQTAMGGLKYNHIRNTMPGHDGLPGFTINPDGSKTVLGGHGIGSNYWDLLPFGWDDMYATSQYYASTIIMADIEESIAAHPEWGIPGGALAFDPAALRKHAAAVKKDANSRFWDEKKGRFVACIDKNGASHDYGFTFLNLDAIWYGIASDEHTKQIMDWINGKRIIEGDTSTGADIYHWRFGPRATTKRNIDWYCQGWHGPESIPFGGQIQDGGAVLGFSFYDLWARLKQYGPDDVWNRLSETLGWEREVWLAGGYREYYKDGKRGTTLQGGGTAGGIGIDAEFFESSLLPTIVTYGFLGLNPKADMLEIDPKLPKQCPEMGVSDVLYHNVKLDIKTAKDTITVQVKDQPASAIRIGLNGTWKRTDTGTSGKVFELTEPGTYNWTRTH